MKNLGKYFAMTLMLGGIVVNEGCKKEEDTTPNTTVHDHEDHIHLTFNLDHKVGSDALQLDTIIYTNAANNKYSVSTCQYFISNIMLHSDTTSVLFDADPHYVDINDAATLSFSSETKIPNAVYDSITFIFGLDTIQGVDGYFMDAPESNMAWPTAMGGGYHYMKLEGQYDSAGVTNNYTAHFGPAMGKPYYIEVTLPASYFVAHGEHLNVNLEMDINEWFTNPMTYDFNVYTGMVMMNMSAQMALQKNGANVFSVVSIEE